MLNTTKEKIKEALKLIMTFCMCAVSIIFFCPVVAGLWLLFTQGALLSVFILIAIVKLIVLPLLCLFSVCFILALIALLFI